MTRILQAIDVETGSLDPATGALLSIGLVVFEGSRILEEHEILVKPEQRLCHPDAMQIHGIVLSEHEQVAVSRAEARREMQEWLAHHRGLTWVGHKVTFDLGFLAELLEPGNPHLFLKNQRHIDTISIFTALQDAGVVSEKRTNLKAACQAFGITIPEGARHTHLGDARLVATLYDRMVREICPYTSMPQRDVEWPTP